MPRANMRTRKGVADGPQSGAADSGEGSTSFASGGRGSRVSPRGAHRMSDVAGGGGRRPQRSLVVKATAIAPQRGDEAVRGDDTAVGELSEKETVSVSRGRAAAHRSSAARLTSQRAVEASTEEAAVVTVNSVADEVDKPREKGIPVKVVSAPSFSEGETSSFVGRIHMPRSRGKRRVAGEEHEEGFVVSDNPEIHESGPETTGLPLPLINVQQVGDTQETHPRRRSTVQFIHKKEKECYCVTEVDYIPRYWTTDLMCCFTTRPQFILLIKRINSPRVTRQAAELATYLVNELNFVVLVEPAAAQEMANATSNAVPLKTWTPDGPAPTASFLGRKSSSSGRPSAGAESTRHRNVAAAAEAPKSTQDASASTTSTSTQQQHVHKPDDAAESTSIVQEHQQTRQGLRIRRGGPFRKRRSGGQMVANMNSNENVVVTGSTPSAGDAAYEEEITFLPGAARVRVSHQLPPLHSAAATTAAAAAGGTAAAVLSTASARGGGATSSVPVSVLPIRRSFPSTVTPMRAMATTAMSFLSTPTGFFGRKKVAVATSFPCPSGAAAASGRDDGGRRTPSFRGPDQGTPRGGAGHEQVMTTRGRRAKAALNVPPLLCNSIDLVVALGGDGTMLWVSQLFTESVPPVLGVAMGTLGYLTRFTLNAARRQLKAMAACKRFSVNLRCRLKVCLISKEGNLLETFVAFNECVIDRGPSSNLCTLDVFCNGAHFTTVAADGLILATPTGSTAYSMSAGGSMVHPKVPCLLFTPICPHTLSFRPVILPDSVELRIVVPEDARGSVWIAVDGRSRTQVEKGMQVVVSLSAFPFPTMIDCAQEKKVFQSYLLTILQNGVLHLAERVDVWLESLKKTLNWNCRVRQGEPLLTKSERRRARAKRGSRARSSSSSTSSSTSSSRSGRSNNHSSSSSGSAKSTRKSARRRRDSAAFDSPKSGHDQHDKHDEVSRRTRHSSYSKRRNQGAAAQDTEENEHKRFTSCRAHCCDSGRRHCRNTYDQATRSTSKSRNSGVNENSNQRSYNNNDKTISVCKSFEDNRSQWRHEQATSEAADLTEDGGNTTDHSVTVSHHTAGATYTHMPPPSKAYHTLPPSRKSGGPSCTTSKERHNQKCRSRSECHHNSNGHKSTLQHNGSTCHDNSSSHSSNTSHNSSTRHKSRSSRYMSNNNSASSQRRSSSSSGSYRGPQNIERYWDWTDAGSPLSDESKYTCRNMHRSCSEHSDAIGKETNSGRRHPNERPAVDRDITQTNTTPQAEAHHVTGPAGRAAVGESPRTPAKTAGAPGQTTVTTATLRETPAAAAATVLQTTSAASCGRRALTMARLTQKKEGEKRSFAHGGQQIVATSGGAEYTLLAHRDRQHRAATAPLMQRDLSTAKEQEHVSSYVHAPEKGATTCELLRKSTGPCKQQQVISTTEAASAGGSLCASFHSMSRKLEKNAAASIAAGAGASDGSVDAGAVAAPTVDAAVSELPWSSKARGRNTWPLLATSRAKKCSSCACAGDNDGKTFITLPRVAAAGACKAKYIQNRMMDTVSKHTSHSTSSSSCITSPLLKEISNICEGDRRGLLRRQRLLSMHAAGLQRSQGIQKKSLESELHETASRSHPGEEYLSTEGRKHMALSAEGTDDCSKKALLARQFERQEETNDREATAIAAHVSRPVKEEEDEGINRASASSQRDKMIMVARPFKKNWGGGCSASGLHWQQTKRCWKAWDEKQQLENVIRRMQQLRVEDGMFPEEASSQEPSTAASVAQRRTKKTNLDEITALEVAAEQQETRGYAFAARTSNKFGEAAVVQKSAKEFVRTTCTRRRSMTSVGSSHSSSSLYSADSALLALKKGIAAIHSRPPNRALSMKKYFQMSRKVSMHFVLRSLSRRHRYLTGKATRSKGRSEIGSGDGRRALLLLLKRQTSPTIRPQELYNVKQLAPLAITTIGRQEHLDMRELTTVGYQDHVNVRDHAFDTYKKNLNVKKPPAVPTGAMKLLMPSPVSSKTSSCSSCPPSIATTEGHTKNFGALTRSESPTWTLHRLREPEMTADCQRNTVLPALSETPPGRTDTANQQQGFLARGSCAAKYVGGANDAIATEYSSGSFPPVCRGSVVQSVDTGGVDSNAGNSGFCDINKELQGHSTQNTRGCGDYEGSGISVQFNQIHPDESSQRTRKERIVCRLGRKQMKAGWLAQRHEKEDTASTVSDDSGKGHHRTARRLESRQRSKSMLLLRNSGGPHDTRHQADMQADQKHGATQERTSQEKVTVRHQKRTDGWDEDDDLPTKERSPQRQSNEKYLKRNASEQKTRKEEFEPTEMRERHYFETAAIVQKRQDPTYYQTKPFGAEVFVCENRVMAGDATALADSLQAVTTVEGTTAGNTKTDSVFLPALSEGKAVRQQQRMKGVGHCQERNAYRAAATPPGFDEQGLICCENASVDVVTGVLATGVLRSHTAPSAVETAKENDTRTPSRYLCGSSAKGGNTDGLARADIPMTRTVSHISDGTATLGGLSDVNGGMSAKGFIKEGPRRAVDASVFTREGTLIGNAAAEPKPPRPGNVRPVSAASASTRDTVSELCLETIDVKKRVADPDIASWPDAQCGGSGSAAVVRAVPFRAPLPQVRGLFHVHGNAALNACAGKANEDMRVDESEEKSPLSSERGLLSGNCSTSRAVATSWSPDSYDDYRSEHKKDICTCSNETFRSSTEPDTDECSLQYSKGSSRDPFISHLVDPPKQHDTSGIPTLSTLLLTGQGGLRHESHLGDAEGKNNFFQHIGPCSVEATKVVPPPRPKGESNDSPGSITGENSPREPSSHARGLIISSVPYSPEGPKFSSHWAAAETAAFPHRRQAERDSNALRTGPQQREQHYMHETDNSPDVGAVVNGGFQSFHHEREQPTTYGERSPSSSQISVDAKKFHYGPGLEEPLAEEMMKHTEKRKLFGDRTVVEEPEVQYADARVDCTLHEDREYASTRDRRRSRSCRCAFSAATRVSDTEEDEENREHRGANADKRAHLVKRRCSSSSSLSHAGVVITHNSYRTKRSLRQTASIFRLPTDRCSALVGPECLNVALPRATGRAFRENEKRVECCVPVKKELRAQRLHHVSCSTESIVSAHDSIATSNAKATPQSSVKEGDCWVLSRHREQFATGTGAALP